MRQVHTSLKRAAIAGTLVAAAYGVASLSVSAQTATTSTPTTSTTTVKTPRTTSTPDMVADAVARSKARHQRFLTDGTPEQFGSEEPFTSTTK
jgi:hypothetical protein